jgi:hypothetical protein
MQFLPDTPSLRAWGLLSCAAVASVVAGAALGFTLPLRDVVVTLVLFGGLLAIAGLGRVRFKSDAMAETCALFAFWIAMLAVLLPASYMASSVNAPFVDATLQEWDRGIGFDWLALQQWTDSTEWAAALFATVYLTSALQIPVAVFGLAATREISRLNTFITALLLATITTIIMSALLPALGAYPTYGFVTNPAGAISRYADVLSYQHDVLALRSGALRELSTTFAGIITFPSYHTVVAVLAAWASWNMRWIGPANGAAAAVVILTTLPIGGHHFVDLIAGGLVACGCVALAKGVELGSKHSRALTAHYGTPVPGT